MTEEDPEHSLRYAERFRAMRAEGRDLDGEARLIDAMTARGSRILDAGCGPGRVGGALFAVGHTVVGVDLDPVLIAAAEQDHPGPRWLVGDLAHLDLPGLDAEGVAEVLATSFDVIVCAGNVMTFLAPDTRIEVLRRLRDHLDEDGRLVVGFGTDRGYEVPTFLAHVEQVDLVADVLLSSWHLHPYVASSGFLVAILRPR